MATEAHKLSVSNPITTRQLTYRINLIRAFDLSQNELRTSLPVLVRPSWARLVLHAGIPLQFNPLYDRTAHLLDGAPSIPVIRITVKL